jgi:F-type H+-transporting ATPase subunit delta
MSNPRLASRYAKSLLDLSVEQNALEPVLKDMEMLHDICAQNRDFTVMLRSPVIKGGKKIEILNAVFGERLHPLTKGFIELLIRKGREFFLPEMTEAFVTQYKAYKGIHEVRLTTAIAIDDILKQKIEEKVSASISKGTLDLQLQVNEDIIGGFVLEVGDKLLDASVRRDLNDIRKQFTKNEYVATI